MQLNDRELIEAVAERNRAALRELYDRHSRWLLLRLVARCSDRGLAEEALQDTWVKVWGKAHTYRGEGDVGGWLWSIAIRSLLDHVRKHSPTPVGGLLRVEDTVVCAEEEVLAGVEHGPLGPALRRLSPELRAVMQATVIDGLTTREAGRLLGIPAGTVKTRAMRARRQLREDLA